MFRSVWSIPFFLILGAFLASCSSFQSTPAPAANMPNPASVFCEQHGGKLELRQDAAGGVNGVCVFPDGSECDEWAYFRGECQPGNTSGEPDPTPSSNAAGQPWKIYQDDTLAYRFSYPADAKIVQDSDPLKGLTIVGPELNGEVWPTISFSHPRDLEAFRPFEGADLLQWLNDHNLVGEGRKPDLQIAGTHAIHFRHERSPQSYAFDQYYFAKAGQLYQIIIGHTGDREDWNLYDHFLQSIQFE